MVAPTFRSAKSLSRSLVPHHHAINSVRALATPTGKVGATDSHEQGAYIACLVVNRENPAVVETHR